MAHPAVVPKHNMEDERSVAAVPKDNVVEDGARPIAAVADAVGVLPDDTATEVVSDFNLVEECKLTKVISFLFFSPV
jgi:hypothetical protein